jgi:uncharacterized protein
MILNDREKEILLEGARKTIVSVFSGQEVERPDYSSYPVLKTHCGAFVTLTEYNSLRGCIGYIIGDQPLFETVCEAAIQASQNDPRFPPVTLQEIKKISIEVSVLSEPFNLNSYDEIEIGKHGLILEEKGRRGLLLPQVPVEHNMNREQFLDAICQKSGFPKNYWRQTQLKLKAFTALVFNEESLSKLDGNEDS